MLRKDVWLAFIFLVFLAGAGLAAKFPNAEAMVSAVVLGDCTHSPVLTGDATTVYGSCSVTVAKVNGVSYPASPSTHQTAVVTASNVITYKTVPDCTDASGNHLNYTQSSDAFSCGTSSSVASVLMAILTSSYSNATTNFTNVAGGNTLQFSVAANTNYAISCELVWQGSASTAGPKFQFTGPASPTAVAASAQIATTITTVRLPSVTAFSSSMAQSGTITATTNFPAHVRIGVVNGANAGTVTLQAAANGTGTLTIQPGSSCMLR
jgi:hypothetical protein